MSGVVRQEHRTRLPRVATPIVVAAVSVLLLGLVDCGYNFPGEGRTLPGGATSIFVSKFENRTRDAGLENFVLESLQAEVARRGQFTLARNRADAQLALEGTILSLETRPVNWVAVNEPRSVEVRPVICVAASSAPTCELVRPESCVTLSAAICVEVSPFSCVAESRA